MPLRWRVAALGRPISEIEENKKEMSIDEHLEDDPMAGKGYGPPRKGRIRSNRGQAGYAPILDEQSHPVTATQLFRTGKNLLNTSTDGAARKRGFACLKRASQLGHVGAHLWLGAAYDYGLGVNRDLRESLTHYRFAADAGNPNGQYHVAVFLYEGLATKKNYRSAVQWLMKAVMGGDADASYLLGICYRYGRGVEKSLVRGFELLLSAARRGVAEAQFSVGLCFSRGEGVHQDNREAFRWYLRAAKRGHTDAAHNLSLMYEEGRGVRPNKRRAEFWHARSIGEEPPA